MDESSENMEFLLRAAEEPDYLGDAEMRQKIYEHMSNYEVGSPNWDVFISAMKASLESDKFKANGIPLTINDIIDELHDFKQNKEINDEFNTGDFEVDTAVAGDDSGSESSEQLESLESLDGVESLDDVEQIDGAKPLSSEVDAANAAIDSGNRAYAERLREIDAERHKREAQERASLAENGAPVGGGAILAGAAVGALSGIASLVGKGIKGASKALQGRSNSDVGLDSALASLSKEDKEFISDAKLNFISSASKYKTESLKMDKYYGDFTEKVQDYATLYDVSVARVYSDISSGVTTKDGAEMVSLGKEFKSIQKNAKAKDALHEFSESISEMNQSANTLASHGGVDKETLAEVSNTLDDIRDHDGLNHPVMDGDSIKAKDDEIKSLVEKVRRMLDGLMNRVRGFFGKKMESTIATPGM